MTRPIEIYQASLDNVAAGGAAPETWLRSAESYARFLARKGDKDKALDVLDRIDAFAAGRVPAVVLRKEIVGRQADHRGWSKARSRAPRKCCSTSARR